MLKTAYTSNPNIKSAIGEIKNNFSSINPKFILFFASSKYDNVELPKAFNIQFPSVQVIGCTTAGEIFSGKMLEGSIVAMAFEEEDLYDFHVEVLENINKGAVSAVNTAMGKFEKHFSEPVSELNFKEYFGFILVDGLSKVEEKVMDRIGDLTNILFIGGSAGDDLKFKTTYVYYNDKYYTNAAILAVIKPKINFDFLKVQSFKPTNCKFLATKVDVENREILELDNIPAVKAYASATNSTIEAVANNFMHQPVGIMIDDEPYVRSPQQVKGEGIVFYCNVLPGTQLTLLESGNIVEDTKAELHKKTTELKKIKGLINFHCILRTLELKNKNQMDDYGKLFTEIPTIGFSTYGEAFLGHINQTSTIILFY